MKKMKKLLSMLLAVVMVLAMAAPSFAADGGSITITNITADKEYNVYKLFGANPSGDGNGADAHIAYTATPEQVEILIEAANKTYDENAATLTDGYFVFTKTTGSTLYNVAVSKELEDPDKAIPEYLKNTFFTEVNNGVSVEGADQKTTVLKKEYEDLYIKVTSEPELKGTVLKYSGLDYGYYFITSTLGTSLTITSTNKHAVVLDKNQGPHWDEEEPKDGGKKIVQVKDQDSAIIDGVDVILRKNTKDANTPKGTTEVSANNGDKIGFEVTFQATDYDKEEKVKAYLITDVLANGMDYVKAENSEKVAVTVKVGDKILEADQYSLSTITEAIDKNSKVGHKFSIYIPWLDDESNFLYPDGNSVRTVTINYSAIVNDAAVVASTGNKNTAQVGYWTEPDDLPENPEEPGEPSKKIVERETTTWTFALAVNKTDKEGNPLTGAKFTLIKKDSTIPLTFRKINDNLYVYDENGTDDIVSPESGVITIKGLAEGTYTLTEVEAPAGYNLLEAPQDITAVWSTRTTTKTTTTIYYDKDGNVTSVQYDENGNVITNPENKNEVQVLDENGNPIYVSKTETTEVNTEEPVAGVALANVINFAGTLLPSTGGIGTTIFYAAGIILMAGAVFFVVRRKKA